MNEIRKAAVIGAGIMGHAIAQLFAQAGISVSLTDSEQSNLNAGISKIDENLKILVENGILGKQKAEEALSRVRPVHLLRNAVLDADLVVECARENLALKQRLFEEIEAAAPSEAVVASNTSSLALSEIGGRVKLRSRLIITHYFNPPHLVPIVEVVPDEFTDRRIVEGMCRFIVRIGKIPVPLKKPLPGFLVNRIQAAMVREILWIMEQDVAELEDIDNAIRWTIGFRLATMGPLELIDFGGLDTWLSLLHNVMPSLSNSKVPSTILSDKVARGALGTKSGKGFFDWGSGFPSRSTVERMRERDSNLIALLKILHT
jgi:3-hydroxybutyryl-CoA dehydrogenase